MKGFAGVRHLSHVPSFGANWIFPFSSQRSEQEFRDFCEEFVWKVCERDCGRVDHGGIFARGNEVLIEAVGVVPIVGEPAQVVHLRGRVVRWCAPLCGGREVAGGARGARAFFLQCKGFQALRQCGINDMPRTESRLRRDGSVGEARGFISNTKRVKCMHQSDVGLHQSDVGFHWMHP